MMSQVFKIDSLFTIYQTEPMSGKRNDLAIYVKKCLDFLSLASSY